MSRCCVHWQMVSSLWVLSDGCQWCLFCCKGQEKGVRDIYLESIDLSFWEGLEIHPYADESEEAAMSFPARFLPVCFHNESFGRR